MDVTSKSNANSSERWFAYHLLPIKFEKWHFRDSSVTWYTNKKKERKKERKFIRCFTLIRLFYDGIKILLKNDGKQPHTRKKSREGKDTSKENQLGV